jgi:hypothetical protein
MRFSGLLNDALSTSGYVLVASNWEMINWWIGKDVGGNGRGLDEVLSRHLPKGTEGNHEKACQDNRCQGRDLNQAPPEYKSNALPPNPISSVFYLSTAYHVHKFKGKVVPVLNELSTTPWRRTGGGVDI